MRGICLCRQAAICCSSELISPAVACTCRPGVLSSTSTSNAGPRMVVADWGSINTRKTSVGLPRITADT
jgi:hypothetical protein